MVIVGSISKANSKNISIANSLNNKKWKDIKFDNKSICLNVCYDVDSDTVIINDTSKLFISDDKLYLLDHSSQKKLGNYEIAQMVENKSIDFIKGIQSNINLFLYDKVKDKIYLASNRATAGRMFYLFWEDTLFFSNDFTLMLNIKGLSLNNIALYAYTKFGAVPEDITFDKLIKSVPVGHYATIDYKNKRAEYTPFYNFNYNNSDAAKDFSKLLWSSEQTLKNNAKGLSKTQVHMLISGGIDSSLFAFYLKEYTSNIIGHFCRFGNNDPEQKYAEIVAKKLNIPLKIHTLYDENVIQEIEDTASNTSYPHGDYSNISVNFIIRKIKEEFGPGHLMIDCNGGDDGFGYAALTRIPIWEKLYKIPTGMLKLFGNLATIGNTWMYDSKITQILFYLYRAKEKNIYISHIIFSAGEKLFKNSRQYNKELQKIITHFFDNNIKSKSPAEYDKMNVAQFYHTNSRLWTAKGYSPANKLNIHIIFPFTWKNMLDQQCEIPLNMKVYNNEIKWPLKKLLEKYMPKDFIYRKKSGFAPPLYRWLKIEHNYNYAHKTIMNGVAITQFKRDKIDKILKLIKSNKKISRYAMNLIWSLLFFEIWLKSNKEFK